jgi:hypothetical protein
MFKSWEHPGEEGGGQATVGRGKGVERSAAVHQEIILVDRRGQAALGWWDGGEEPGAIL